MKFTTRLYCNNPVAYEAYINARVNYKAVKTNLEWCEGKRDLSKQILAGMIIVYRRQLHQKIRHLNVLKQQKALDVSGDVVILG